MKESQKILTVVVPAYNMEKYLPRCLDSLIQHSELENDIEILVVNDGSSDGTLDLARDYASRHDCITVIDKANGGWGSAVNESIKQARGVYFKILDADDYFAPDAFAQMVDRLRETKSDIFATSYATVFDDKPATVTAYPPEQCGKEYELDAYLRANGYRGGMPMASLSVRTAILQAHHFTITERYYADIDFLLNVLFYVRSVTFSPLVVYQYYQGRDGQSTSADGYARHAVDFLRLGLKLASSYEAHKSTASEAVKRTYLKNSVASIQFVYQLFLSPVYNSSLSDPDKQLRDFDVALKETSSTLYKATAKVRRKGVPFIWIWRKFHINLFSYR